MDATTTVVFALYPGITPLDYVGPHQVLAAVPGVRAVAASMTGGELVTDNGVVLAGLAPLPEIERCDVICTVGGAGLAAALLDTAYVDQVARLGRSARYVTSVCTGSLVLGAAGLLQGRRAACHWAWRDLLPAFGATPDPARVVRDGNVLTGGGITAGVDFGLVLAAEISAPETAQRIQLSMEYAPAPPFDCGRPELAPPEILEQVLARYQARRPERVAAVETASARLAKA